MTDSRSDAVAHFPAGRLRPADWTTLAGVAADHRGDVQLAPRSGARVRRADGESVATSELVEAGLPPQVGDDRLPHIIASPLAGRLAGHHDLADLSERLCAELLGRAGAAALRGSLLLGLDDGSGDVLAHSPDLAVVAGGADGVVRIHVSGPDVSVEVSLADAAEVLVDVTADVFCGSDVPSGIADPERPRSVVVDSLRAHPLATPTSTPTPTPTPTPADTLRDRAAPSSITSVAVPRVGWVDTADGLVSLFGVVPHGVVPSRLAEFLGAIDRPSTLSADRVIGLHELTEEMAEQVVRVLAPMGLVFDASSPWATDSA